MKKLNAILLALIFTISMVAYSCSASGKISVKQQSAVTVKVIK